MVILMIGNKIKELRKRYKMTQKTLAKKLYVTPQAISRWENGIVEPSLQVVVNIAIIFNVQTDYLLEVDLKQSVLK